MNLGVFRMNSADRITHDVAKRDHTEGYCVKASKCGNIGYWPGLHFEHTEDWRRHSGSDRRRVVLDGKSRNSDQECALRSLLFIG